MKFLLGESNASIKPKINDASIYSIIPPINPIIKHVAINSDIFDISPAAVVERYSARYSVPANPAEKVNVVTIFINETSLSCILVGLVKGWSIFFWPFVNFFGFL